MTLWFAQADAHDPRISLAHAKSTRFSVDPDCNDWEGPGVTVIENCSSPYGCGVYCSMLKWHSTEWPAYPFQYAGVGDVMARGHNDAKVGQTAEFLCLGWLVVANSYKSRADCTAWLKEDATRMPHVRLSGEPKLICLLVRLSTLNVSNGVVNTASPDGEDLTWLDYSMDFCLLSQIGSGGSNSLSWREGWVSPLPQAALFQFASHWVTTFKRSLKSSNPMDTSKAAARLHMLSRSQPDTSLNLHAATAPWTTSRQGRGFIAGPGVRKESRGKNTTPHETTRTAKEKTADKKKRASSSKGATTPKKKAKNEASGMEDSGGVAEVSTRDRLEAISTSSKTWSS